ncbi:MAG: hypothetical protein WDO06_05525 [Actinomycetota bacterium]
METHHDWEPLLLNSGYSFCYKDGLNRFYLADEKRELLVNFDFPPNIFDEFTLFYQSEDGELEVARDELKKILNSSSWRITSPLRRLKTLFFR